MTLITPYFIQKVLPFLVNTLIILYKLNDYSFDDVEIETQKRILNEIHPNKA